MSRRALIVVVRRYAVLDLGGTVGLSIKLVILSAGGYPAYATQNGRSAAGADVVTAALAWLATTRAGRWLLGVAAAVALAAGVLLRTYGAGRDAEESRQARDSLDTLRTRNRIDEDVDRMGAARARDELARWERDDRA